MDTSVQLVQLPSLWRRFGSDLWGSLDAALDGQGLPDVGQPRRGKGFRDVARRTTAMSGGGALKHELTCLSQHGLERRTMYALFLEEIRRRGLLVDADAASAPAGPRRRLFLIPILPLPQNVNASMRTLLSLGLQRR